MATSIFTPITNPVLTSIDPEKISKIFEERKRYEDAVTEKEKEVPAMTLASYNVSIDRTFLENMFFIGEFDTICLEIQSE